ncbi:MAG TPA: hypothetical protein VGN12_21125 [Pirellulales bacterium]|jgi:hypothetical protein
MIEEDRRKLLLDIIHDYLREADRLCKQLAIKAGTRTLLAAWRSQQIPKDGELSTGTSYSFHGIGVCFEFDGLIVDVDFANDGEWDAFDTWRLHLFARGRATFESIQDFFTLKEYLNQLEADGLIKRAGRTEQLFMLVVDS